MAPARANFTSWWAVRITGASLAVIPIVNAIAQVGDRPAVAKTFTPSITAAALLHPGLISASKTVTPAVSPAINLHPGKVSDSLSVTPTLSASASKIIHISASLTVTPTLSASASTAHVAHFNPQRTQQIAVTRAATR